MLVSLQMQKLSEVKPRVTNLGFKSRMFDCRAHFTAQLKKGWSPRLSSRPPEQLSEHRLRKKEKKCGLCLLEPMDKDFPLLKVFALRCTGAHPP